MNRISPLRFIVGFGVVSALADEVYEGARSIIGPFLGQLGLSDAEQGRAVELTDLPEYMRMQRGQHGQAALYCRAVDNPSGALDPNLVNSAARRAGEIPAINGHGASHGVAGLYVALLTPSCCRPPSWTRRSPQNARPWMPWWQDSTWGLGFAIDADGFDRGGFQRGARLLSPTG